MMKTTSQNSNNHGAFNDVERSCVKLLNESDTIKNSEIPPKPAQGTCHWIHSHPLFNRWLEKGGSALLWLTGHPGCGKTILSSSLAEYFLNSKTSQNVLIYLCQNKNNQTNSKSVLISLIFQLINRHRSLIRHVRKVFDLQGSSMIQSFASLWGIFLKILKDKKIGSVCIILDALDECETTSCQQLLQSISDMLSGTLHALQKEFTAKFLVTSRPFLHQSYASTVLAEQPQITIDDGQVGYAKDIEQFIHQRVSEISLKRGYNNEIRDFLIQTMTSRADRTFLWIHLVLVSIEESPLTSKRDLENILARIPKDLETVYLRYLSTIPPEHHENASLLLRLLLASARPLHLAEINIAFTISHTHRTIEDLMRDTQHAITHTLQGILGPLVRISAPNVTLVHQSAKEFLLEGIPNRGGVFTALGDFSVPSSALQMASTCIQYLLLDDFSMDLFCQTKETNESPIDNTDDAMESPDAEFAGDLWGMDEYNLDTFFSGPEALYPDICASLEAKYKLYSYASLYWAEHFARCEEDAPNDLRMAAKSLLDTTRGNCQNWLRFFRTKETDSTADAIIDKSFVGLAAQFNLPATLKDLLDELKPSQTIKNRSLYWASRLGHDKIVDVLLAAGAEPNSQELEGHTALTIAADYGNLPCLVRLLADDRTDTNMRGRQGRCALSYACGSGFDDVVQTLLDRNNCNINCTDYSGATPFFWAVEGGHRSIISLLAKHPDMDINHQDKNGRTALSWAAGNSGSATLKQVLKIKGLNANIKDNKGKSPILWAARQGLADNIKILIDTKVVDKTATDDEKRNAISLACEGSHYRTLVRILQHDNSGVDEEDINGWTPLMWAIQNDSAQVVAALIGTGRIQIDQKDNGGRTALAWAVSYGHSGVVQVLLRAGADLDAQSKTGETPISICQSYGRTELLKTLLAHKERL